MGFSQGLSGLKAASKALDVVGNNIANSQTIGFKAGTAAFADIFAGAVGLGVQLAGVTQDFGQGNLNYTGRNMDIGINGRGFFRMASEDGSIFYGRNGQFEQDKNGNIYNKVNNLFLTGYQAVNGQIVPGSPIGPVTIPTGNMAPEASTTGSLTGNLDAGDKKVITAPFDHTDPETYNYVSHIEATDSLGNKHAMKVYFVQDAAGQWKAYGYDETAPKKITDPEGGPDLDYSEVALVFNTDGTIQGNPKLKVFGAAVNGSSDITVELDLAGMTKQAGESLVKGEKINGHPPGQYQNFTIGDNGEVVATYSNGQTLVVAQIILADFANSGGLEAKGNNVWAETPQSGQAFLGTSGVGSFGSINGQSLEASNVELGDEMVNMIVYQRNYQSNSQTIKTQSELLQTLVNMR
ncbi:flagellar hook protein FlgE [Enterobacter ludwigii]|uniref:flagellar hook protein FlgE n=1 Tax=Enterobacter TaxID=547 RepID=UPI002AB39FF2|nr:flagellar hook protein FlgE [Enterobacter ludwigii]